MLIAVINESSLISNAQVQLMCSAIQIQLNLHFLPAWNMKSATVQFYSDATKVPGYAWVVSMLDNSTQAGALGYHSLDNDKVDAFIFAEPVLQNGGAVMIYNPSNPTQYLVSATLSHEICEMIGDRYINTFCVGPQISEGNLYCMEMCDAVEDGSYSVLVDGYSIGVSNFLYPSYFNQEAVLPTNAPLDYMNKLTHPFTMTSGGYMIVATFSNEGQVTAQKFGETMPAWRKDYIKSEFYRR